MYYIIMPFIRNQWGFLVTLETSPNLASPIYPRLEILATKGKDGKLLLNPLE